jgi:hypothetical protein
VRLIFISIYKIIHKNFVNQIIFTTFAEQSGMIEGLGSVTTTGEYTPTYPYMGVIKIIY